MKSASSKPILVSSLASLFTLAILVTLASSASAADASGTWKWSYTLQNGGTIESSVDLAQQGDRLTGTYHSSRGGDTPIQDGKVQGDRISFVVNRQIEDRSFKLTFSGTVEGDSIDGKLTVGDGDREFDWKPKREAKAIDPSGTWTWTISRPNGQTIDNVLVLKREGGQLAGTLKTGQGRELAIQDAQLAGNEISFNVTRRGREGRMVESKFAGKLEGNTIKGEMTTKGGNRDRTQEWTATRAEAEANVAGKWDFSVTVSDDRVLTAVLDLKRDGKSLTGALQGDDWELPISEGKVEGNAISFTTIRQLDDGGRTIYNSSGKVSGDTINGTVKFETPEGESRTLEWKATRR